MIDLAALSPTRHRFMLPYAHHGHALQTLAGNSDAFALWFDFTLPAQIGRAQEDSQHEPLQRLRDAHYDDGLVQSSTWQP
ncbi:MAG: hypothetical protein JNJ46_31355 [Myxococcales bacterium]|nr:hypothetical protein [Myxococcales bacterium]